MNYKKAQSSLEQARSKLQRLKTYTGPKVIKAMDSRVDQTRFDERARGRVLQLEQATLERLQKQLEVCRIVAPCDGRIVHVRQESRADRGADQTDKSTLKAGSSTRDESRQRADLPAMFSKENCFCGLFSRSKQAILAPVDQRCELQACQHPSATERP